MSDHEPIAEIPPQEKKHALDPDVEWLMNAHPVDTYAFTAGALVAHLEGLDHLATITNDDLDMYTKFLVQLDSSGMEALERGQSLDKLNLGDIERIRRTFLRSLQKGFTPEEIERSKKLYEGDMISEEELKQSLQYRRIDEDKIEAYMAKWRANQEKKEEQALAEYPFVAEIWEELIADTPELEDIPIKRKKPMINPLSSAHFDHHNDEGKGIHLPFNWKLTVQMRRATSLFFVDEIADVLGIKPEEVTDEMIFAQEFTHEAGHAVHSITDREDHKDSIKDRFFIKRQYVEDLRQLSPAEALRAMNEYQKDTYKGLHDEQVADEFAYSYLASHKDKFVASNAAE